MMKTTLTKLIGIIATLSLTHAGFGQLVLPLGSYGDNYIGGDPTNSSYDGADVIGTTSVFNLTGASVSYDLVNDSLSISILGNYFDNILSNSGLLGTSMGDLFISTDGLSWDIGDNTDNDFYGSGIETSWEYAVKLGTYTQPGLTAGTEMDGTMVQITDPGSQIILSSASGIYRSKQEHQVTGEWAHNLTDPTWNIVDGSLNVTINDFMDFFGPDVETLGFHWAMACANDVLEFEVDFGGKLPPVPEPSSIGLMGLAGLGGLLFLRRKLKRK